MEKLAALNLIENPTLKSATEAVPKPPTDIDVLQMTEAQLHAKLQHGYDDYKAGRTLNAAEALKDLSERHI